MHLKWLKNHAGVKYPFITRQDEINDFFIRLHYKSTTEFD